MLRIAICDDDNEYANLFKQMLLQYESRFYGYEVGIEFYYYQSAKNAIDGIKDDNIDIYFIDIEFGELLGMDLAKQICAIRRDVGIVYITNHENYVIRSFVCRPLGFIRKKMAEQDLGLVINSVNDYLERENQVYVFYDNKSEKKVNLKDVIYVEMYGHYMRIVTVNGELKIRDRIMRVEEPLCKKLFVKINRSFLLNLRYISKIEGDEITLLNNDKLYSSASKKNEIMLKWQQFILGI